MLTAVANVPHVSCALHFAGGDTTSAVSMGIGEGAGDRSVEGHLGITSTGQESDERKGRLIIRVADEWIDAGS